ncbi:aldehyde ferredoxin oxidoreductase C-terminal domain-containing protein [Desulfosarcina cetonica]|uniref:aldehyde ferredoxin oxidoreductase C-terminal domain-containing protein n=1 Tax=Desulfosarcina cetonica TaxID=90730 RepID=UPI0027E48071|nr:aldehyde ferredoxin oxidoreductase C-terminal domain-containing protein [Desulfosarcina cetonica]
MDRYHGNGPHPSDQLLQLFDEMWRNHRHARPAYLYDEMLHQTDLYHGAHADLEFGLRIAQKATEYGLDGFSAPQVMAFALELLEHDILSADDFPDMPEDSQGRFFYLLEKIVRREGIGDILANGTYWAAQAIGNGADAFAHNTIKKHEQLPLKLSMLNPIYFLMYSTGEKINITQIEGQFPQAPFPKREQREEFVKDWIQVPDEKFKQYFLDWEPGVKTRSPTIRPCR